MAKNINMTVGERLDHWGLPKDVRDVINNTEFRLIAELFGDFGTAEGLVDYIRANWDCEDHDRYDWWELNEWNY